MNFVFEYFITFEKFNVITTSPLLQKLKLIKFSYKSARKKNQNMQSNYLILGKKKYSKSKIKIVTTVNCHNNIIILRHGVYTAKSLHYQKLLSQWKNGLFATLHKSLEQNNAPAFNG